MYELFDLRPNNKEVAFGILGVLVFLVAAFSIGYMLGVTHTRENVHDNGNAVADVRSEIESAGSDIGAAKSGIDHAAAAAGRVEERIVDAAERAEYLKGTANEGRRIISECQSIISEVRRGNQTGTAPR